MSIYLLLQSSIVDILVLKLKLTPISMYVRQINGQSPCNLEQLAFELDKVSKSHLSR